MVSQVFTIEFDDEDDWVTFATSSINRESFRAYHGFGEEDVKRLACGTAWVREREGKLYLAGMVTCSQLAETVSEMLEYFDAPGRPTSRLCEIRAAASEYIDEEDASQIPDEAYAWLDVVVREEVADEARDAKDVWNADSVQVQLKWIRRRHVEKLVAHFNSPWLAYSQESPKKMAPSHRDRGSSSGGAAKIG